MVNQQNRDTVSRLTLVVLMSSILALAGCGSSSSNGGGSTDNTDSTNGDTSSDNEQNGDQGSDSLVVEEAIVNGENVADANRTVWDCGSEGILSFWADGEGSRVVQSTEQTFLWESQVAGTITVNGEFSAAFFNFDFTDQNNFSASEASSSIRYSCTRSDQTPASQVAVLLPGYVVVRGETVSADGVYTVTAACPAGMKVLGGGGSQGSFGWFADDSRPESDGSGWQVQYAPDKDGGNGSGIGEAWAICAIIDDSTILDNYEVVRGETLTSDGTYTATADCPSGKQVLGGGGSQGAFGWYLDDSRPNSDGSGWQAQYSPDKEGGISGGIGEAWAVCATITDPDSALSYEIIRGDTVVANGGTYTATADCSTGKSILGGGASQGDFGWYIDDTRPDGASAGWQAQYSPDIDGTPGNGIGEAWAICAFTE